MAAARAGLLCVIRISNRKLRFNHHHMLTTTANGSWAAAYPVAAHLSTGEAKAPQDDLLRQPFGDLELAEAQRLARIGNWRWDFETDTVYWSATLYDIFGIDPSGPAPSYAEQRVMFHADSFAALDAAVRSTIITGMPYVLDLQLTHSSGEPRWMTARGEVIRDATDRIVALRGTVADITERQILLNRLAERERALKLSEQRFRASFNSMFQYMAVLAPDGTLLEVNETAASITGGSAADQLGKPFWKASWWRKSESVQNGIRVAVARAAAGEFVRYDADALDHLGNHITADLSIKPAYDEAGNLVLLIAEGRDVTEDRQTRETLRKSQERFQAIFNSTFQFIGLLTPEGTLLEANQTAVEFAGLTHDQLVGRAFWDCHWWTHSQSAQAQLKAAVLRAGQGQFMRFDIEIQGAGGTTVTIDFSLKPVRGADGQVVLLIPEGRDVTEERRTRAALEESESRFRLAMQNAPIGKALVALDGRWISANDSLCKMLGYSEAELLDKTFQDITHPDDLDEDLDHVQALLAGTQDRYTFGKRYLRADGGIVSVQLDVSLLRNAEGQPLYFISQIQDITDRRELEAQREALTQRLTLALRASGIGVWEWDLATNQLTWDAALKRMYGVGDDVPIQYQTWRDAVVAEDLPRCEETQRAAVLSNDRGAVEYRIVHPKLGLRFIESLFGRVLDQKGRPARMVGVNIDVTERWLAENRISETNRQLERRISEVSELQEQLREQAIRDGLTGLYNRRYFDERLASELEKAAVESRCVSLMIADLDHFKTINDRFGHQGGDALLRAWSALLRANLRGTDVLCRYGGEEFAIVLPGSRLADAEVVAEQLRSRFEGLSLPAANGTGGIGTTVSIGVAHLNAGSGTAEQLIRAADAALYRAKTEGRNRVVCEAQPGPA